MKTRELIAGKRRAVAAAVWVALLTVSGCAAGVGTLADRSVTRQVRAPELEPVGFVVVAPDRGFLGNEETGDAFAAFAEGKQARLVFVTDERTGPALEAAVTALAAAGVERAVVLPFFVSPAHPRLALVRQLVAELEAPVPVQVGRSFGESYLAVEVLADRFRAVTEPAGRTAIVVGYGAQDPESRRQMEADWQRLADVAAEGIGFAAVSTVVWYSGDDPILQAEVEGELGRLLAEAQRPLVVPFHLGKKLDGMMSFTASLRRLLPEGVEWVEVEVTPDPLVALWMEREANRATPLRPQDIGVVFLAHGSDYHWNETMRQAVAPLAERYKVEFAFCMADPPLVERAVRHLEARGARAIVVVRVFGLESSFQSSVERMLGLDVEAGQDSHVDGHHESHGHGYGGAPPPRIRTAALTATAGGLEDHPYFARALLDRALELSRDPSHETVILVAHGTSDEHRNDHWRQVLQSLAGQMLADGGADFRAIHTATWREDWPDQREPEVAAVRRMVEQAATDGGRAIVLPARTTGQGSETKFLEGLAFDLGSGFAPHPLFAPWVEAQVQAGLASLAAGGLVTVRASMAATGLYTRKEGAR